MKLSLVLVVSALLVPLLSAAQEPSKFDFSSGEIPSEWSAPKGEWKIADGALSGAEVKVDKHAAVLALPDAHTESSISFRFQLNGAKAFHLSYNHLKGHLFRVRIGDGEMALVLDKDKKNPESKAVTLQKESFQPEPGTWYEMKCQVSGDQVSVACGEIQLSGTHPDLAKEKTGYRFIVQGETVLIDDVVFSSSN